MIKNGQNQFPHHTHTFKTKRHYQLLKIFFLQMQLLTMLEQELGHFRVCMMAGQVKWSQALGILYVNRSVQLRINYTQLNLDI